MTSRVGEQLLFSLGAQVRTLRKQRAWSLRELADHSGLSTRFLSDLEQGRGNVSVMRLAELARCLGTSAGALLLDAERSSEDATRGQGVGMVALVGLRGAGKSTIGQLTAEKLGVRFVELDSLVSERAGLPIGEIFDLHGLGTYRKLERVVLDELLETPSDLVVATGGSLVTEHSTYERLLGACSVVWLRASAEDHFNRVLEQGDTRPMRHRENAMDELRSLLRARNALYDRAHHSVDTSRLGVERAATQLASWVEKSRRERLRSPKRPALPSPQLASR